MKLREWQRKLREAAPQPPKAPVEPVDFCLKFGNAVRLPPALQMAFNIVISSEGAHTDFGDKEAELLAKAGWHPQSLSVQMDKDILKNEDEVRIVASLEDGQAALIPLQKLGQEYIGGKLELAVNAFFHSDTRSKLKELMGERADMLRHVGIWMEAVKHDLIARCAWPYATVIRYKREGDYIARGMVEWDGSDSRWPKRCSKAFSLEVTGSSLKATLPPFPGAAVVITPEAFRGC